MKKLYTFAIALLAGSAVFAQSQRLTLLEEFTQASCGPCAAQNPALNALLELNESKVVSIKYQTNWPGVDPMNTQTQTWVGPRVSYYNVSGVPNIAFDGNVIQAAAPSTLTQTGINNRYAVASPFDLAVSHSYNATYDSITISIDVTATQAASGTLVLHTVLVEKEIAFCVAPGSNGETEFYSVMRKMLPNAAGTAIGNSWTVGQTQNYTFTTAVPTYVYDKKELAIVAFIQDNATKEVKQAGLSNPLPIPLDASIKVCGTTTLTCVNAYTPTIELINYGTNDLTSVDFSYTVGASSGTFNWTGVLSTGASATVSLPVVTLSSGTNNFSCSITSVNGGTDFVTNNDTYTATLVLNSAAAVAAPVVEGFTAVLFPPTNWLRINGGNAAATWSRLGVGATANNGSAKMDFYNSPGGDVDELFTAKFDLTNAINPNFSFVMAKAGYAGYTDMLEVMVSTDCGATWNTEWTKSDPQLMTAGNLSSAFTPTAGSTTQWRAESFSLNAYVGQAEVLVKFRATSGYGNNLFVDDINLSTTVGVGENQLNEQISLFPTPSSGTVFVNLSAIRDNNVRISILDVSGKVLDTYTTDKSNQHEVNMKELANGSYMIQIDADGQRISKKVILNR
ncbi:MAG: Omp28-related outer membrane protein [Bacteroidia bacterium]|nr:Omp28-related outer membrane protein [Bacteroidia bacterium]